jgi:hypothetical protein
MASGLLTRRKMVDEVGEENERELELSCVMLLCSNEVEGRSSGGKSQKDTNCEITTLCGGSRSARTDQNNTGTVEQTDSNKSGTGFKKHNEGIYEIKTGRQKRDEQGLEAA